MTDHLSHLVGSGREGDPVRDARDEPHASIPPVSQSGVPRPTADEIRRWNQDDVAGILPSQVAPPEPLVGADDEPTSDATVRGRNGV